MLRCLFRAIRDAALDQQNILLLFACLCNSRLLLRTFRLPHDEFSLVGISCDEGRASRIRGWRSWAFSDNDGVVGVFAISFSELATNILYSAACQEPKANNSISGTCYCLCVCSMTFHVSKCRLS